MNRNRTAPAVVGLLVVPATLLLGAWTPALADGAPGDPDVTASATPTPTDTPTAEPTDDPTFSCDPPNSPTGDGGCLAPPPVDCTQYGPDAVDTGDGHCAIPDGPVVISDPPPSPDPGTDPAPATKAPAAEPTTEPTTDPSISVVDSKIAPLPAQADNSSHGGTLLLFGLGISLAAVGGLVIRYRVRKD